ncbi:FecR family protein [Pedobacter psychroterrae]|uniref:DUF4974 domain-containing protein n=1 Tax=Pedobacter psychroterrae TaxID=2530453 RepID=A0A4R0NKD2_9SPHI|nr:FecR domain-containing protein [Pedobacter psychroterrae]TCD00318.1 DUF4974 domain-containing protein [Pedobacter psychroterrae]
MENIDIIALTKKYNAGDCTPEEIALLENWYLQWIPEGIKVDSEQITEASDAVWSRLPVYQEDAYPELKLPSRIIPLLRKLAVAASLLICIGIGFYFYQKEIKTGEAITASNDIAPGGDKAILTLSNGEKVLLDSAVNGELMKQAGITITKTKDGELIYTADKDVAGKLVFNTIETPKGGQYTVILPDGSRVWINAASKLVYPVRFAGTERSVDLVGEAYFEVVHNKAMPFRVKTAAQQIEVLGTHFNVNSYPDEPAIKTTLLEGLVRIAVDGQINNDRILKPGEQSVLADKRLNIVVVNTEEAIAWKNGDFVFENQTLPEIMRKISRWYDVEIDYQQAANPQETFSGTVSRSRNLSAVLKMLELTTQFRFRIKGNNITVIN